MGKAAGKVEALLVVSGLNVDRSVEARHDNMCISIKEADMGGGWYR